MSCTACINLLILFNPQLLLKHRESKNHPIDGNAVCAEQQSTVSRCNGNIIDVEEPKNSNGKIGKKGKNVLPIRHQN